MTFRPLTQVIIYAPANLQREAWRALLANQPSLVIAGLINDISNISLHPEPGQPASILIDQSTPNASLASKLKTNLPDLGLLFMADAYDLVEILPLLQAGAEGCIVRDASVTELARSLIAVGRGEIALPPHIAARALAMLARGEIVERHPLIEPLSEREVQVLHLLAQGLTNKDIAQTLILSVRTVEAHLRNIFGKLNIHSRTEAALWATKNSYGSEK